MASTTTSSSPPTTTTTGTPAPDQISALPPVTRHITTHDENTSLAIFSPEPTAPWQPLGNILGTAQPPMAFNLIYSTTDPLPTLSQDNDLSLHTSTSPTRSPMALTNPTGSVCRFVDFAPSTADTIPFMHRTQSLDYGVVVQGEVELWLDGGEKRVMHVGDVAVQRGTMHAWRNRSGKEWARMMFVLIGSEPVVVGGKALEVDLQGPGKG